MSAVSGSGGSGRQDDTVRRQREEYAERESQTVKKHHKEIRHLNEAHQAEVDRIKEDHSKQVDSLRDESRKLMSVREMRHQKEMEDLRDLYRKQAQAQMQSSQDKMEALKESIVKDHGNIKDTQESQLNALNEHYREVLEGKDRFHEQNLNEMRDSQQEAIANNRERLMAQHRVEKEALLNERKQTVSDLQKRFNALQTSSNDRLKAQEVAHIRDKDRMSDNLIDTVRRERQGFGQTLDVQREGSQESIRKMAERFEQASSKEKDFLENSRKNLEADVTQRMNNQVRRLERQVADLGDVNVRRELEMKRRAQQEVENFREAYQNSVKDYQDQLKNAVESFNETNSKDIAQVRKDLNEQLVHSGRFYRQEMASQNAKNREAYDQLKTDFDSRQKQSVEHADLRVEKVRDEANLAIQRMKDYYQTVTDEQRATKDDEKNEMRLQLQSDQNQSMERLRRQVKEAEIRHERKVNELVGQYEKKLAEIKDQRIVEKNGMESSQKRLLNEVKRQHENQLTTQKIQYEEKLAELNDRHQKEMQTLHQRYSDQIDRMSVAVKKT